MTYFQIDQVKSNLQKLVMSFNASLGIESNFYFILFCIFHYLFALTADFLG